MKFSFTQATVAAVALSMSVSASFTDELNAGLGQIHNNAGDALGDVAQVAGKIKRQGGFPHGPRPQVGGPGAPGFSGGEGPVASRDFTDELDAGLGQIHNNAGAALGDVAQVAGKIKRQSGFPHGPHPQIGGPGTPGFMGGEGPVAARDFTAELNAGLGQIHSNAGDALGDVAQVAGKIKREIGTTFAIRDLIDQGRVHPMVKGNDHELHTQLARSCAPPPCGTPSGCNDWTPCLPTDSKGNFVKRTTDDVKAQFDASLSLRDAMSSGRATLMVRGDDFDAHTMLARSCAPPPCGTPSGCNDWTPCLPTDSKGNFV